jgi:hypothetical protein
MGTEFLFLAQAFLPLHARRSVLRVATIAGAKVALRRKRTARTFQQKAGLPGNFLLSFHRRIPVSPDAHRCRPLEKCSAEGSMKSAHRFMASLLLTGALVAPVAVVASPAAQDVYDREHKDHHKWDDHENEAWRRFLAENHRKEHEFAKANRHEQQEYWNWRHGHPD